jgi:ElaB/YqjD/DUF883 family membrane-anchored ribosome-binding protein
MKGTVMETDSTSTDNNSGNSPKDHIASAERQVKAAVSAIGEKVSEATEKLREYGSRAGHVVHEQVDHLCEKARDTYDQGKKRVRNLEQGLEDQMRRHPLQTLLIGAGIGALLVLLLKPHPRHRR